MKIRIAGPQESLRAGTARARLREDERLPDPKWLGIDLDLPSAPREGQYIVLDSGSVYVVTEVTWFIETEAGDRDALAEKNDTAGRLETVYVSVKPKEDMHATYGNDFQIAEAVRRVGDLLYGERAKQGPQGRNEDENEAGH